MGQNPLGGALTNSPKGFKEVLLGQPNVDPRSNLNLERGIMNPDHQMVSNKELDVGSFVLRPRQTATSTLPPPAVLAWTELVLPMKRYETPPTGNRAIRGQTAAGVGSSDAACDPEPVSFLSVEKARLLARELTAAQCENCQHHLHDRYDIDKLASHGDFLHTSRAQIHWVLQMTKLAIIPFTVMLETIFLKKRFSETIKFSLLVLLLGVGIASVTDLKLNLLGSILSALAIATTCVGQILTNTIQRKLKVSSTQLLYQSAPYQAAILFATGPFVDQFLTNRSVFAHKYTFPVVAFIILSCLIAVSVNFSTFLVIGTTSPVTYQVLGHLKTCLVLSFGYTLLHDPFTMRNVLGILVAIFGMALYSYFSVREGKTKKGAGGDALPVTDKETEPLVATKDVSDTKKTNGVAHDQ
ncbi:hypothetical protein PR202_gb09123 [Eleusine coracana subsp. coracana]|uniref:Sugar phosphate transporter domain-containing protein n=1 Tax=Eleusine coracana subsp. coracana TaxID=191504 RepID=A0AAV5EDZ4_ELECO|nr:hypothetical protein PR202_gb09123 [Eleusine coracana subsp. coracana]